MLKNNWTTEPDENGNWLPLGTIVIVNGAAKGADNIATDWAINNWVAFQEYPADWEEYGKAAGPIRNKQMLDTGIDLVVAFLDETERPSKGTRNMIKQAEKAGVETIVYEYEGYKPVS